MTTMVTCTNLYLMLLCSLGCEFISSKKIKHSILRTQQVHQVTKPPFLNSFAAPSTPNPTPPPSLTLAYLSSNTQNRNFVIPVESYNGRGPKVCPQGL
ncbi:hypothetical protein BDZ45DRAFT_506033 [Acephala macrosclerotiorum]|nr:hypothetical protein BDZ45DRAFT_506033 [Acephala macrosclerotiorum]